MSKSEQKRYRAAVLIQTSFWVASLFLSIFWFQEIVRATNDLFSPSIGLLIVVVTAIIYLYKTLTGANVTTSSLWVYGLICLLLLFITILQIVYVTKTPESNILPTKEAVMELFNSFSLRNFYIVLVDSWLLFILHVGTLICGISSIVLIIKANRDL